MIQMNVLFLIPALEPGGAQRQLIELIKGLDKNRFAITLATFYEGGMLWPDVEKIPEVKLVSLKKSGRWDVFPFLFRLWRTARQTKPQIMYGYMNFACNLCLLVGRAVGAKVVWSLRSSNIDYKRYGWPEDWNFRVGAWLSHFANLIIVNSHAGKQYHSDCGYSDTRMVVIPNGIDTEHYYPAHTARATLRAHWGIAQHETLIGLVGRLEGLKDHPMFLRAAAELILEYPDVRFVCVGTGSPAYTTELRALGEGLGLGKRLIWAGATNDMPPVYNALDLLVSSSSTEGFSNAIGEAMACGVPCVVTDVGDSALIVDATGDVVPPQDSRALAQALRKWLRLSRSERQSRGVEARARIEHEFNMRGMVTKTEAALQNLLTPERQP